ncbi:hypothetical protein AXF42_Ash005015 [Apostasia shenzhenica]|uniref:DUF1677 domain-containing protein n=1 Tax=Apostasia shenzhenica TaxID=1088818 RepID=A0A2I0B878_9ASPA|nr:hypothetical protein AXF42_Ash005015 [Apostasia shenzhenica]
MSGEAVEEDEEEFGFAECECCGLTEEYTATYVAAVRGRYGGRSICGLCAEAVEEEIYRSAGLISTEEALRRQASFCSNFRSAAASPGSGVADHLIAVVMRLIRRSLDSPPGKLHDIAARPRRKARPGLSLSPEADSAASETSIF